MGKQIKLKPKQMKFLEAYAKTGDYAKSYLAAGYKCKTKDSARTAGSRLLRKLDENMDYREILDSVGLTDRKAEHVLKLKINYENEGGVSFVRDVTIDMIQYADVLLESFKDSTLAVAEAIKDAGRSRQPSILKGSIIKQLMKKPCPMCAEMIPRNAKKCSHCKELLEDYSETKQDSLANASDSTSTSKPGN